MIPLKLTIKNFLSYSTPQEIDFEPYSLICLAGKNGHGKSALLDALTWVIWGQARKSSGVAKADEGLLHLGQTHMMVSLTLICNGARYLIKREYSQSGNKGQAQLEFGLLEAESGHYRALTDKTIKATQAKIIQIVGLDYESFINSAFLRQGQSQEFSTKSPKERKDILATILGLEHFEELRERALTISKEAAARKDLALASVTLLEEELKEKSTLEEEFVRTEQMLNFTQNREKELRIAYDAHKEAHIQLQTLKIENEKIIFKKELITRKLDDELSAIRKQSRQWRTVLYQQRDMKAADQIEKEHEQVQQELNALQIIAAQKLRLKEEFLIKKEALRAYYQERETTYAQAREAIDREIHRQNLAINNLTQQQLELNNKLLKKEQDLKELTSTLSNSMKLITPLGEDTLATLEKRFERRKGYYHTFLSRMNSLKTLLEGIVTKKQLISASKADTAECPLCNQITHKEKLTAKYIDEEKFKKHQINRLTIICSNLTSSLRQEHDSFVELKSRREENQMRLVQCTELEKQLQREQDEFKQLIYELRVVDEQKKSLLKQLEETTQKNASLVEAFEKKPIESNYQQLDLEVKKLEQTLESIPYHQDKETTLMAQLATLARKRSDRRLFAQELALQDERKRTILQKADLARTLKKELIQFAPLTDFTAREKELARQEEEYAKSFEQIAQEKESLMHQKGSLEARIAALSHKEKEAQKLRTLLQETSALQEDYANIAAAFGKDGIQALLIEDALPEIEEEANNLLSRLTDNRAHISIDSLRDTKSGKTKETLDIKISDAVGVRPYEMFSGGEAFRIDFSLRVALSKLLARRAGTSLQTLIIDEGFGSQDEEGLAHIMEALHHIREDFAKVIVVSHLAEMKEQFPVHFHVQKTAEGTVVQSIEHC